MNRWRGPASFAPGFEITHSCDHATIDDRRETLRAASDVAASTAVGMLDRDHIRDRPQSVNDRKWLTPTIAVQGGDAERNAASDQHRANIYQVVVEKVPFVDRDELGSLGHQRQHRIRPVDCVRRASSLTMTHDAIHVVPIVDRVFENLHRVR